ncbi:hypothetical protein GGX14DRAFT_385687 [Mycena pura]|uniref:Uncharacterized protein n=1 Tax=Mycena pura TaxID=153505 RepID=A0AAD6YR15_9AGAR|nr:hypothetical protein GGX14DRAFT_385687 [Mycena pura]
MSYETALVIIAVLFTVYVSNSSLTRRLDESRLVNVDSRLVNLDAYQRSRFDQLKIALGNVKSRLVNVDSRLVNLDAYQRSRFDQLKIALGTRRRSRAGALRTPPPGRPPIRVLEESELHVKVVNYITLLY